MECRDWRTKSCDCHRLRKGSEISRRHSLFAVAPHNAGGIQRHAAVMLRRTCIPLFSHGHILSSSAGDQGSFTDRRTFKHIDNLNAHAHSHKRWKHQIRGLADIRSDQCSQSQSGHLPWPELTPSTAIPTPYQIFHLDKKAVYSKKHFYELVKIYHPDRHLSESSLSDQTPLPSNVRIERYRLVVAANDILSDPVKRDAYDRYGSGWGKNIEKAHSRYDSSYHYRYCYHTKWSGFYADDSPMKNATWEDWERWYQRHNREKQESVHFSHETFLFMAIALASLVGVLQAKRMGATSFASPAHFDTMTGACNKNIQSRRSISLESESNQHRLQRFLESRAPHADGIIEPKDDIPTKLLSPPES